MRKYCEKYPHKYHKRCLLVKGLKENLLSASQLCEKEYSIVFYTLSCLVFNGSIVDNIYLINIDDVSRYGTKCLINKNEYSWLWHRCLGHMHFDLINKITSKNLVDGLPNIKLFEDKLCDACQMGKQMKVSFKPKNIVSTSKPLELLHLDLFGP